VIDCCTREIVGWDLSFCSLSTVCRASCMWPGKKGPGRLGSTICCNSVARFPRERRARTTRFADASKWPSMLRSDKGISKVVLGYGFAGAQCKSSEGCTEAAYPPLHVAARQRRDLELDINAFRAAYRRPRLNERTVFGHKRCDRGNPYSPS
jgi:hypothetical protein